MRRLCGLEELEEGRLVALDCAEAPETAACVLPGSIQVLSTSDFPADVGSVLALRAGERVRVWHNVCPHAGRRLDWAPGRFLRDGEHLVCAQHGAVFELVGGECVSGPCRGQSLSALAVELRDGGVWIGEQPRDPL